MKVLEAKSIVKYFPGVKALQGVDFDLEQGEVHALVGENGAGKSTLVKILTGIYQPDSGTICINGRDISHIANAQAAFDMGISVIHQELNLMPHLDVATNIYIGRLPKLAGGLLVDWKKLYSDADRQLEMISADFSSRARVFDLSVSQQQQVEIAKSLSRNPSIIFMDEPTSSLTSKEVDKLFTIIEELKKRNISIVYISHKLDEIMRASDRISILRDGKKLVTAQAKNITVDEMIGLMVGGTLKDRYPKEQVPIGDVRLEVKGLSRQGEFSDVSFNVRSGEILGLTGLMGAGRTEVAKTLFGASKPDAGEIYIDRQKVRISCVKDAINAGISLLTEDRKTEGLMLGLSVNENSYIAAINCRKVKERYSRIGFVRKKEATQNTQKYVDMLSIKTPSLQQRALNLSGGNQQKVIIGKWLSTESKVMIFDDPTRGIDVGTKAEIYKIMQQEAKKGTAIIMISSELPEIMGISDRVIVMRKGRMVAEIDPKTTLEEEVVKLSATQEAAG